MQNAYQMKAKVDQLVSEGVLEADNFGNLRPSRPCSEVESEIDPSLTQQEQMHTSMMPTRAQRKAMVDSKMKNQ